jgi:hypothetical protein
VNRDHKGNRVSRVRLVLLGHKEPKVRKVKPALPERKDLLDHKARLDPKAHRESKGYQVLKVSRDLQE